MFVPQEKINKAKEIYGEKAINDIIEYFGVAKWDERAKKGSCPWHTDVSPSFIWNSKKENKDRIN